MHYTYIDSKGNFIDVAKTAIRLVNKGGVTYVIDANTRNCSKYAQNLKWSKWIKLIIRDYEYLMNWRFHMDLDVLMAEIGSSPFITPLVEPTDKEPDKFLRIF